MNQGRIFAFVAQIVQLGKFSKNSNLNSNHFKGTLVWRKRHNFTLNDDISVHFSLRNFEKKTICNLKKVFRKNEKLLKNFELEGK